MSARPRILLAESDSAAYVPLMAALRKKGIEVVVASDAVHVLNVAKAEHPEAVVLSSGLAGGCLAGLRRLRSNVHTSHIPVVGVAPPKSPLRAGMLGAGAQQCIDAPATAEAVKAAVEANQLPSLDFTQAPAAALEAPARLAELKRSGLLDSAAETQFDLLTRLAAKLLGASTALMTLVDRDRQFFKSQTGLKEPWAGARQTRLSHSFCQWVVSGKEDLVINDATSHPVLKKNLAIRDLGVVAYAGVPLYGKGGEALGSFCAIDSSPREWSEKDLSILRELAGQAQALIRAAPA
jgi:CheY-like chemotaxis protein